MYSRIPVSRQRRARQKGNVIVEVALTFVGFVLLTVGTMEYSLAMQGYDFCSYAARDATRWASVRGAQSATASSCDSTKGMADGCPASAGDLRDYVKSLAVALDTTKLTVTTEWSPDNNPGSSVKVTVAYQAVPMVGLALKETLSLSSTSQMMIVR